MSNFGETGLAIPARSRWPLRAEQLCILVSIGLLALAAVFARNYDADLLLALQLTPNDAAVSFWKLVSFLGSGNFLAALVAIACLTLVWKGRGVTALGLALGWIACGMTVEWLKWLIARDRPPSIRLDEAFGFAFPSGHAARSLFIYAFLFVLCASSRSNSSKRRKVLPPLLALIFGFLPVLIGLSRLYLGLHWPSDVLAGWGIGLFFSGVVLLTTLE
ncbi:MAG: phosphatase PAP2 family protein [Acidobacteria bacterium]|nr:phosphatase PAP2 family protein [Acidobacteriota bacterium]